MASSTDYFSRIPFGDRVSKLNLDRMPRLRRKKRKSRNMEEQLASYADYLFEAPDYKVSIIAIILISALVGATAFTNGWKNDIIAGFLLLGMPALLSVVLTTPLAGIFGNRVSFNRSALMALFSLLVISLISELVGLISFFTGSPYIFTGFVMGLSLIFALRMMILLGISVNSFPKVIIPASLQTVITALFMYYYIKTPDIYVELAVSSIIFVTSAFVFVRYVDYPMVKSFGVSSFDFIQDFIAHLSDGSPDMEEFFEKIGESIDAPVSVLSFKKLDGTIKALIITPYVHPGPMGEIGGGNLPAIVSKAFDDGDNKTAGLVFVPHGTAYHDFNLVTAEESEKIINAAKKAIEKMTYGNTATRSVRIECGNTKVLGQKFNDSVFLVSTQAPTSTEDIEFAVGFTAMAEGRVAGAKYATIIDAHNCTEPFATAIEPGTRDSYNIIRASANSSKLLLSMPTGDIRLGVANSPPICTRLEGMGDLGITVAVVEVQGQLTAYIVIDGNNMVRGLREKIIEKLPVDEAEVMTTDTHVVNTLSGANYVGQKLDCDLLINTIAKLVDKAIADLEPVEAGMEIEIAEDVRVFGSHKIAKLASTANAMVAMSGAFAAAVIIAALSLTILIFVIF
jgi:putative membrane protein